MRFPGLLCRFRSMRIRLMLAIAGIVFVCQFFSGIWLWHESREQVDILVYEAVHQVNQHHHYQNEIYEAIASLTVPSLIIMLSTLFFCWLAIKKVIRPLGTLTGHLSQRTEADLHPVPAFSNTSEVAAVIEAINLLMNRLNLTLERERQFTADVAHELRTPLAGLRLHLELIEKQHQLNLSQLKTRLDQMTASVVQLLMLARAGQSFAAGDYQQVSLQSIVSALRPELEEQLASRQQQLTITLPAQELVVAGDATLLRLVMRNLIENAHRYSHQHAQIGLMLQRDDLHIRLTVTDDGPGIDQTRAHELNKAFVRMDSRYDGAGLGLNIVQRICQLHHASFTLSNRQPHGCQAQVVLPVCSETGKPGVQKKGHHQRTGS